MSDKPKLEERGPLSPSEQAYIMERMQAAAITSIHEKSSVFEAIFHGGNGARRAFGSPRASEDLDFYLVDEVYEMEKLGSEIETTAKAVESALSYAFPGSSIAIKAPKKPVSADGPQRTASYRLTWSHPKSLQNVRLKLEFCLTKQENFDRLPVKYFPQESLAFPAPELSFCDKIVAIANRPEMKARDVFDLAFVATKYDLDDDKIAETMDALADIYGLDLDATREKLDDLPDPILSGEKLAEAMREWLPDDYAARDFGQMVSEATDAVEKAKDILARPGLAL